jgi:PAS domain S-box-containing protein
MSPPDRQEDCGHDNPLARFQAVPPVPMWIFDQQTLQFLDVNDEAVAVYGYSRPEFLRMTILDIRPIEDVSKIVAKTMHPRNRGPSAHELWRHRAKNGAEFEVEINTMELLYEGRAAELVVVKPTRSSTDLSTAATCP